MKQAIWRWTKRGIFAVIALLVVLAVTLCLFLIYQNHRIAEFNRTHERPLSEDPWYKADAQIRAMFAQLKPVQGPDNIRFVSIPSFGNHWFAVSVSLINDQGTGEALVTSPKGDVIRHETFIMPKSDLLHFLTPWDNVVDGYSGEASGWTDGTRLTFERRRGVRVTSGSGNSPCHYDVLGDWAAQSFERYVPEMRDLREPQLAMLLKSSSCNRSIFGLR